MKNKLLFVVVFALFAGASFCSKEKQTTAASDRRDSVSTAGLTEVPYRFEVFGKGLVVPWAMAFTADNRLLVTERNGSLRQIVDGKLIEKPLRKIEDVEASGEAGLMGLTLDPDYENNAFLYISYAYENDGDMKVKVVRFKDNGDNLSDEKIIFDNIPAMTYHAGCRIKFGPDGKLYVTTGDAGERDYVQNKESLYGKILRINSDGSIPEDNPFPENPVWSYGHRNPQGIAWHPVNNVMFSTDHGPSGFDGPGGGDELNAVIKGGNYGWPLVSHKDNKPGLEAPLLVYTPAVAPAACMVYTSDVFPQFRNNLFFACLRGSTIMRVQLDDEDPAKVISADKLEGANFGRIREIIQGPDGNIYFSTSNRDGRGRPNEDDDRIIRIVKSE